MCLRWEGCESACNRTPQHYSLSLSACVFAILRIPAIGAAFETGDLSHSYPLVAIFSMAEVNTGIICASLPTLRSLVSRFWRSKFSTKELKSIETNATEAQYLKVNSGSRGAATSGISKDGPSELLATQLQDNPIASFATYVRNEHDSHRRSSYQEGIVSVLVPADLEPNQRLHVFTVLEPEHSGNGMEVPNHDRNQKRGFF